MQVSVNRPKYEDLFQTKISKAIGKELYSQITEEDDIIFVQVLTQGRVVGKYTFKKDDTIATIEKSQTIERDYFPFEFCIYEVVKYCKRKKIKYIDW